MNSTTTKAGSRLMIAAAAWDLAAALLGFVLGYAFGIRAGGVWIALVSGLSAAVFSSLLADAVATAWLNRKG